MLPWKNTVRSNVILYAILHLHARAIHSVLAQVEATMVKPQPERPFEGSITIHSEISPMASSDYEPGR
jgi:hypothetical protein